jgi:acyl-coenzyme A synthetase/AMP-(fatty) acid ligase
VTLSEHLATVRKASDGLDRGAKIFIFTDILKPGAVHDAPYPTLHDLIATGAGEREAEVSLEDIAVLQSTSGTTGLPKMSARTHRSMILESQAIEDNNRAKQYKVRRLFCTPIFHAFSTPEMLINPLRLGYPTYIMRRFDNTFAQKVHGFRITETAAPPPMLMKLHQQVEQHKLLQSLRLVFSGGAPLAAELRSRFLNIFDLPPRIVQVWGMTEGGWFTTFKHPEDDATGSVGRLIPGYEIKTDLRTPMRTAEGREAGELLVRSLQLMNGYFGNEDATENAFDDGWLKTGDVGYVEDGKVYLIDRVKDLIKVNGWQVAPAELEAALFDSSDVVDAAAISAGSGIDEHPLVFVVARNPDVKGEDIARHLHSRLARYKVASVDVRLVESIPRNPSGKILKKVLRDGATTMI